MASSSRGQTPEKRLLNELKSYQSDPNPALLSLGPINDEDIMHWRAVMKGVEGTAYEGGLWALTISIPPTYPLNPPKMLFETPICHPNIHFQTGEICLDLLKTSWSPAYTISSTLTAVQNLLTSAEPDSPLNVECALLMREGDWAGVENLVRYYTESLRWEGDGRGRGR